MGVHVGELAGGAGAGLDSRRPEDRICPTDAGCDWAHIERSWGGIGLASMAARGVPGSIAVGVLDCCFGRGAVYDGVVLGVTDKPAIARRKKAQRRSAARQQLTLAKRC